MEETKQEKLPIDAKLLSEAVIELNISRRSVGLYPPEHPILKESIQRAFEFLTKLFELRSSITLGIAKDALIIDEYTLDKKNPVFQEFALSLHSKGIAAVTFNSGLDTGELVGLHELITMREGPAGEGLLEIAEKKKLRHIKIVPIDFTMFSFKEGQAGVKAPESLLWEDYIYGLLEGRLTDTNAGDVIISIPPEEVAVIINRQMPEGAPEETYDRVISTYLREKGERKLSKEIFDKFLVFVDNLRPELKAQFLERALIHPPTEPAEIERMLSGLKDEDLKRLLEVFQERSSIIPESLKNLIEKLEGIKAEGGFIFGITDKGKSFMDDIEIDDDIAKLLQEDHFKTFVSGEYQKQLEMIVKGIEAEGSQLLEELKQDSTERELDRAFSEIILELLESDSINREDYLKILTKLSELVDFFLETGRFQEICDIYNRIYSHSLSGRFQTEASGMLEYFFQSEQFIPRLMETFMLWGRYDRESATALAKVLKLYLITPLLDAFSEQTDPNLRKFLLYLLSNMGGEAAQAAVRKLDDEREYVIRNMISLIRECGIKSYARYIKPFARHKDKKIGIEAVKTLLHLSEQGASSYLKEYMRSDDPELREQAVVLSGTYRVKDMVPYLLEFLEKRDIFGSEAYYKIPVIKTLAQIGDPRAMEPLMKLYAKRSFLPSKALNELKLEIFRNLRYYPPDVVKPFIDLGLSSKDREIKSISERLLKEIQQSKKNGNA